MAHPLTEALMKCCVVWEGQAKEAWISASWAGGNSDPLLLAQMRERASVFAELRQITAETIEETLP